MTYKQCRFALFLLIVALFLTHFSSKTPSPSAIAFTTEALSPRVVLSSIYNDGLSISPQVKHSITVSAEKSVDPAIVMAGSKRIILDPSIAKHISARDLALLQNIVALDNAQQLDFMTNHPSLYIPEDDRHEVEEGRTIYLELQDPIPVKVKGAEETLVILRLKGIRIRHNSDGRLQPYIWRRGHWQWTIKLDDQANIKTIRPGAIPTGGLLLKGAQTEKRVMEKGLISAFDTDYPAGLIETDETLNEAPVGAVIMGMMGPDLRLSLAMQRKEENGRSHYEKSLIVKDAKTDKPASDFTIDEEQEFSIMRDLGRKIRAFNDAGRFHSQLRLGNIGIVRLSNGTLRLIIRDLDETEDRETLVGNTNSLKEQEVGYRFLDIARLIDNLLSEDSNFVEDDGNNGAYLIRPFLQGYFYDVDQNSREFVNTLQSCRERLFCYTLNSLINKRITQTSTADRDFNPQNPYIGPLLNLLDQITLSPASMPAHMIQNHHSHEHVLIGRFG